jgi:RecJ-like exonuclease
MPIIIENDDGEEISLPVKFAVCPTCRGKGTQALHGLEVTEMVREDPDFAEDYWSGGYDHPCDECKGERVVEVVDEDRCDPATLKLWFEWCDAEAETRAMEEAERRMGC